MSRAPAAQLLVASGHVDGVLRVWDAASGACLREYSHAYAHAPSAHSGVARMRAAQLLVGAACVQQTRRG